MEIRKLDLNHPRIAERVKNFLSDYGLRLDGGIRYFVGLFDPDDNLVGCGGLDGNIIKCLAMSDETRGTGASATLISHLVSVVLDSGSNCVRVFTKPEYKNLFKSKGARPFCWKVTVCLLKNTVLIWHCIRRTV